nr:uncharacterized protein LOC123767106 isoform X2 [Procambarus clarkii]
MRNPWEEVPLSPHRHLNALTSEAPGQESLDWKDVWYRLDDGRGRINLSDLENRVSRTTNNTQAIAQALSLLGRADVKKSGFVEYAQFKDFYNTTLPATSWERAVLARVALDVNDLTISFDEEAVYSAWVELVNYMHTTPSNLDFNWLWLLPSDYDRTRLPHSVYYKSDLVHPWRLREWLLRTKAADDLPNITVIKLLEKCEDSLQEADANRDGYIEYKEFLRFVTTTTTAYRGSTVLRRGALGVLPRSERTLAKRRYLEECSCCPPPLFMLLITVAEVGAPGEQPGGADGAGGAAGAGPHLAGGRHLPGRGGGRVAGPLPLYSDLHTVWGVGRRLCRRVRPPRQSFDELVRDGGPLDPADCDSGSDEPRPGIRCMGHYHQSQYQYWPHGAPGRGYGRAPGGGRGPQEPPQGEMGDVLLVDLPGALPSPCYLRGPSQRLPPNPGVLSRERLVAHLQEPRGLDVAA